MSIKMIELNWIVIAVLYPGGVVLRSWLCIATNMYQWVTSHLQSDLAVFLSEGGGGATESHVSPIQITPPPTPPRLEGQMQQHQEPYECSATFSSLYM